MGPELVETWEISARINRYVLDAIADEVLLAKPPKGRSIAEIVAHLHNVRIDWLKSGGPTLVGGLVKLEKGALTRQALEQAHAESALAVAKLIARGIETGRIKGFKPHPTAFAGYMIAHDAYHRGEVGMVASSLGFPLDSKTSFGMWEWGVR